MARVHKPVFTILVAGGLLLGAAQPAAPPEPPAKFIHVDELKALLDRGEKVPMFDVRTADAYADLHIKGAKNLPLRQVEARADKEVPKQGRVVLY